MKMENKLKVINKSMLLGKEIDVYGTAENPLFKAKDVADWMEILNVSDMIKNVDEEERSKFNLGRQGETWMLTEDGLYEVLMQSRKPVAKQFKKGVKEILKSIRKTGSYSVPKPLSQLEVLQMTVNQMVEQEHRLSSVERDVADTKKEIAEMKQERVENERLLLEAEIPENKVPEVSMRNKIRKLVNQYAAATNTSQRDVWHKIYDNLYYAYNISINSYKEKCRSKLDIAEKHGFLGKMFDIVSKMVRNNNQNK